MIGSGSVPSVASASDAVAFGVVTDGHLQETLVVETREAEGASPWLARPQLAEVGGQIRGGVVEEWPIGAGVLFRRYRFTVDLLEVPAPGDLRGRITFPGTDEQGPATLQIAVHGTVRPPVYAVPGRLYASCRGGDRLPPLRFLLMTTDPSVPLGDYQVEPGGPFQVHPGAEGQSGRTFELACDAPIEREQAATIVLRRAGPGAGNEVRLPVQVVVATP